MPQVDTRVLIHTPRISVMGCGRGILYVYMPLEINESIKKDHDRAWLLPLIVLVAIVGSVAVLLFLVERAANVASGLHVRERGDGEAPTTDR